MGVFNHQPLRKAYKNRNQELGFLLLAAPHVMEFAMRQNGLYDTYIVDFVKQRLNEWKHTVALTSSQKMWLHVLGKYPAVEIQVRQFVDAQDTIIRKLVQHSLFKIINEVEQRADQQPEATVNLSS